MKNKAEGFQAVLYSAVCPDGPHLARITGFLKDKYQTDVTLEWVQDETIHGGFRLEAGTDIYDWSADSRHPHLIL